MSSPVAKMVYTILLPLIFLFFNCVEAQNGDQNPNPPNYNPLPRSPNQYNGNNLRNSFTARPNPLPPGTFKDGVFIPDRGRKSKERVEQEDKNSPKHSGVGNGNGNIGVISNNGCLGITTENGQTVVKATIGGKSYTATFPGTNTSISTSTATNYKNGRLEHTFKITVNNETYVYTTVNGKTTVTKCQEQQVNDGGPFKVTSN
ncbi:unnamed protein product [Haemonchus placei]|uniref:Uncharacterized protein n=1 Tax=Haemonchus placei TaxID=6290 RepID=A0A0N4X2T5_HAEPC|nr:unnamed protein product [Haemonchus placei]